MPPVDRAVCVVVRGDGAVLVVRRTEGGRRYCVLPGGEVEPGEDPADAALRELGEETGLTGVVEEHLASVDHPDRRAHYFLVAVDGASPDPTGLRADAPGRGRDGSDERYRPAWVDAAELDASLRPRTARALVREAMAPLRPMRLDDLDAVGDVQEEGAVAALSHIFPQDSSPYPRAALRERWEREVADPGTDCFVVGPGRQVDGFAATRGPQLLHFGTARRTWGSGLARRAHDALVAHLRDQGHDRANLWVFEDNRHARRFYAHRGWVASGARATSDFPPRPVLLEYVRDTA